MNGRVLETEEGLTHDLTGHVIGTVYYCTYWRKAYIVLAIVSLGYCTGVEVLWDDNETGQHCTPVDLDNKYRHRRDLVLEVSA